MNNVIDLTPPAPWNWLLPLIIAVLVVLYIVYRKTTCFVCERWLREESQNRRYRPAETLDSDGGCPSCGKFWLGDTSLRLFGP